MKAAEWREYKRRLRLRDARRREVRRRVGFDMSYPGKASPHRARRQTEPHPHTPDRGYVAMEGEQR